MAIDVRFPEPSTATRLRELALSLGFSAIVRAAVKLRIPDLLGDDPAGAAELAAAANADADTLDRLMRALAVHGVFRDVGGARYAHTELSRRLRADASPSLSYLMLWLTAPWTWQVWPRLDEAVRTGKPVFPEIFGKEFFAYLSEDDPETAAIFNGAMTQSSALSSERLAETLDVTGIDTVADVGGGQGHLLRTLLERHSWLRGVLFDLDEVVAGADPTLKDGGRFSDRVTIVGGDCRQSLPAGADLYLFKNLLEWDDDSTLAALRNVVVNAAPGTRVVVVQNLVEEGPDLRFASTMDLFMLLNVGGKKHTIQSLAELMGRCGIEVVGVEPLPGTGLHVVEGVVQASAGGGQARRGTSAG
jgi:C-methyltransferase